MRMLRLATLAIALRRDDSGGSGGSGSGGGPPLLAIQLDWLT